MEECASAHLQRERRFKGVWKLPRDKANKSHNKAVEACCRGKTETRGCYRGPAVWFHAREMMYNSHNILSEGTDREVNRGAEGATFLLLIWKKCATESPEKNYGSACIERGCQSVMSRPFRTCTGEQERQ